MTDRFAGLGNTDCWSSLENEHRPIFIYGMGNGASKIFDELEKRGVSVSGVFASDDFVRGHSFRGFRVMRLSEVEALYDDFVIVLAFAAGYPSLIDKIRALAVKHTLIAPDVPVFGNDIFDSAFYNANLDKIKAAHKLFSDDFSRFVYEKIIEFKLSGDINRLFEAMTPRSKTLSLLSLSDDEIYIDGGAFNGDTVSEFLSLVNGRFRRIVAFEPDERNFRRLCTNVTEKAELRCEALWDSDTTLFFTDTSGRKAALSHSGREISARSLDSFLQCGKATYIKLDVEGAEKEALLGSSEVISKYAPKLLVSVYHKSSDIFELPLLIASMNPNYRFYLRHEPYIPAWDTNLICV